VQTGRVVFSAQEELAEARAVRKRRLVFVALLAILISVLSMGGNRSLVKIYQMGKAKAELYREMARLKQVNRDLAREVHSFGHDPARVEAIAREELGLVKPGEVVYQFGVGRPTPVPRAAPR
jgi:cell division protein FtsL